MKGRIWTGGAALGLVLATLAGPADVAAQEAVLGFKGGIDSYNLSWKPDSIAPDIGHKTGFVGGLFGNWTLTRVAGIQLEFLYSDRRVRDNDDGVELKGSYIEVPLLFTAKFPVEGTAMRPILFAGPSASFETKCKVESELAGSEVSLDCDDPDVLVERTKTDWALVFGFGVDYPVGKWLIGGEFRREAG